MKVLVVFRPNLGCFGMKIVQKCALMKVFLDSYAILTQKATKYGEKPLKFIKVLAVFQLNF